MKIYVSGPMTGIAEHNFPAFKAAAAALREAGFDVEDPSEKGIVEGWEWEDYLKYDLIELCKCDAVAVLPDWHKSRGAQLEVHVAEALGMLVLTPSMWIEKTEECI